MSVVTNTRVTQVALVRDLPAALAAFDSIRWFRSTSGPNGYYEQATDVSATPAVLACNPVTRVLTGTELRLRLQGVVEFDIPFVGPDPIELEDIAEVIGAATALLEAEVIDGTLYIRTAAAGSYATIEVLACSAAQLLGLMPGEAAIGLDPDNQLASIQFEYRYVDSQSSPSAYYRTAYVKAATGEMSPLSVPFPSRVIDDVPLDALIGCTIRLADAEGRALGGRRVYLHNLPLPNRVLDAINGRAWGVFRQFHEVVTDPNGYAQIFLLRGAVIDVTISGTGFTRRVQLPTVGSICDLLDPALSTDNDEFAIHRPKIDFAIRTS